MPMNFSDMKSLKMAARVHKFRKLDSEETEEDYREALANYVESADPIEAEEIRNKVGWDKFTDEQNEDMLRRNRFVVG